MESGNGEVRPGMKPKDKEQQAQQMLRKEPEMGRPIEILLVEDNSGDVRLTIEALKEGKITNNLQVARDGEEALDMLQRKGKFASAARPDIIFLDLNLPKKDGREVLAEVKNDETLRSIPVVILTTSKSEEDVLKTYQHHANCYVTKPIDINQFISTMKQIEEFWLTIVKLPPRTKDDDHVSIG
jgi:CheY-like chemotaxis protein